ncbi:MAG: class I SAM-dependent methyltransferase [Patescibacteria group bacterium]|nr:class I SAM-dependent methyltransferase [Patescibacteria group bacterium]
MTPEQPPTFGGIDDWRGQYNTVSGPEKIEARQRVYWLAVETDETVDGLKRVDLELETLIALQQAGVSNKATIVDIGCSFPNFLQLWKLHNHHGRLIGIEPNSKQLGSLAFWQPSEAGAGDKESYVLKPGVTKKGFEGIELYEAWADSLPLSSGEADVTTMMFMMYHVPKDLQLKALQEAKRIQKPQHGIFALATRGKNNKAELRQVETAISEELSRLRGETVVAPPPVNSGFTSENAAVILPEVYEYVYAYQHRADLVMNSPVGAAIINRAVWSLLDKYVTIDGQPPTEEQFSSAVMHVLRRRFLAASAGQVALKDVLDESLFVASDSPLDLPSKFVQL